MLAALQIQQPRAARRLAPAVRPGYNRCGGMRGQAMSERLRRAIHEAERGDLRPQFNPGAAVMWQPLPGEREQVEPVLFDRFLELSRPIADASTGAGPQGRLQDAGRFFYLVEALRRLGCARLEETLCVLLDEFAHLDERSYDELYLWCLVELSRTGPAYVDTYWPQVLALDTRYRAEPWQRPEGVHPVEQPYRMTDLLFYYYVLYTLNRVGPPLLSHGNVRTDVVPGTPTLGRQLKRIAPQLSAEQVEIARQALQELEVAEPQRPAFGDALGLLPRSANPGQAPA
jgi:hypothetical protein